MTGKFYDYGQRMYRCLGAGMGTRRRAGWMKCRHKVAGDGIGAGKEGHVSLSVLARTLHSSHCKSKPLQVSVVGRKL